MWFRHFEFSTFQTIYKCLYRHKYSGKYLKSNPYYIFSSSALAVGLATIFLSAHIVRRTLT